MRCFGSAILGMKSRDCVCLGCLVHGSSELLRIAESTKWICFFSQNVLCGLQRLGFCPCRKHIFGSAVKARTVKLLVLTSPAFTC